MTKVNISGLAWPEILMELYSNAPIGSRSLDKVLTDEEARKIIDERIQGTTSEVYATLSYINGRHIRVRFVRERTGNKAWLERCDLYDQMAGKGTCQKIIQKLKIRMGREERL